MSNGTITSTSGLTFEEMAESLTGFDEIAITKHMGMDIYTDGEAKPVLLIRSYIFVHQRRQGLSDVDAKKAALRLTLKACNDYFEADAEDDVLDDDPETEAGKDATPPG